MHTRKCSENEPRAGFRSIAEIFYGSFFDPYRNEKVPWKVCCSFCGSETFGISVGDAAYEFELHMVFGLDTSQEHFEFAERKRRRNTLSAANRAILEGAGNRIGGDL